MNVIYCDICTFPPEYCEWAGSLPKCKKWLKDENISLFAKLYPSELTEEELSAALNTTHISTTSSDQNDVGDGDIKKEVVQPLPSQNRKKAGQKPMVTIKRQDRNKRKSITTVTGMEQFQVDLKKAAKLFANKFACGSSVSKNASGVDEIVIQGDVQDALPLLILENFAISEDSITIKQGK